MAYREFENQATYEAPEIGGLLEHTMNTLHNVVQEGIREKRQNRAAAERFKFDSQKGYYASDQDVLDQNAREITGRAINEYKTQGHLSPETSLMMQDHKAVANRSKIDWDTAQNVRKQIMASANKDKYYDPDVDNKKLVQAEYDGDITNRNERIQKIAGQLGGVDTFNKSKFLSDYIQKQKLNSMQQVTDQSGVKTTKMTSSIFMKPDGTPGVTDNHIVDYFNGHPQVEQFYNDSIDKQIGQEVKKLRALGNDERVSWLKGMSDEDAKAAIIENPNLDLINSTPFAIRKKELAKNDLEAGQDLNRKTAIDYSDTYNSNGGKFNNTKIGYQPTNINQSVNFKTLNGAKQVGSVGADLTYVDKGGPIKFVTNTPIRANVGTGEVDTKASDNLEFNLTNYGLYAYDKKGQLYPFQGTNLEELKKSIDGIPDRYFDPNSAHPLSPEMSVGLNGYAINKSKLINQSLSKQNSLAEEYHKAVESGDDIKAASIKSRMEQVDKLRSMASNADADDIQVLLAGKQLGISGVQNDYILKASDQDFAKLKTITNGLDLRDQNKWTDEMKSLNDHYKARYAKAQANLAGEKKPVVNVPKTRKTSITPDDFNTQWAGLNKGEKLVGPDGKTYVKK